MVLFSDQINNLEGVDPMFSLGTIIIEVASKTNICKTCFISIHLQFVLQTKLGLNRLKSNVRKAR